MSEKVAIKKSTLEAIGEAVRGKEGSTDLIPVNALANRITALPTPSGENKFAQLVDGTITEATAEDLEGITQIMDYAFFKRKNLTSITIPDGATSIGVSAFQYCNNLKSVIIGSGVTTIKDNAFDSCGGLTSITIPDNVASIGSGLCVSCRVLTSATLSKNITTIPSYAFSNCFALGSITIPDKVTSIGTQAFGSCKSLTSITIPDSVTRIDTECFFYCTELTSLTIGNGIKTLRNRALEIGSSSNKATITFLRETPPSIDSNTFKADYLNKIIVPKGCGDAYKSATNWANFADFIEEVTE